jgi:hypothetical protein
VCTISRIIHFARTRCLTSENQLTCRRLGYAADHAQRNTRLVGRHLQAKKQVSSGWSASHGTQILGETTIGIRTHKVPGSKNPVKVQVLVGPDESLGTLAEAAVQGLSWQAQEALQTIPPEIVHRPGSHSRTGILSETYRGKRFGPPQKKGILT